MSKIMAHRGARNLWAENSLLGFRETLKHAFPAVEFDVHRTDAGELVVIHDASLERTTNGTGPVRHLMPEIRKALRLKGPDGALIEEGVPTLTEVLEVLAVQPDLELWVELKSDETGKSYAGLAAAIAAELRRMGLAGRAVLHSFDIDVIRDIREVAPEMRTAISVNAEWAARQGGILSFLGAVDGLVDHVGIHHELFEANFDAIAEVRPVDTCTVWTLNDPDLIRRWIPRGIGFLVSDNPVLVRELVEATA